LVIKFRLILCFLLVDGIKRVDFVPVPDQQETQDPDNNQAWSFSIFYDDAIHDSSLCCLRFDDSFWLVVAWFSSFDTRVFGAHVFDTRVFKDDDICSQDSRLLVLVVG